jgi:outer membrane lipopolysaccharide assembly protein LptE/RlpB
LWCPDKLNLSLLTSLLLLAGCGFQLRGSDLSAIETINLTGPISTETRRAFVTELESYGVEAVASTPGVVSVRVNDERSSRRPVSTSANIDAAQYELRLEIDVSISLDGNLISPDTALAAERIYSVDSLNLSGSYEEQQILLHEIRRELASQVVSRVEAWLAKQGI